MRRFGGLVSAKELVIFSGSLWLRFQIIPLFFREKVKMASRKAVKIAVCLALSAFAGFCGVD